MNLADAMEKLRTLIREYEYEAPATSQDTLEKIRKRYDNILKQIVNFISLMISYYLYRQEKAARERLFEKRQRSQVKADRQGPSGVDI